MIDVDTEMEPTVCSSPILIDSLIASTFMTDFTANDEDLSSTCRWEGVLNTLQEDASCPGVPGFEGPEKLLEIWFAPVTSEESGCRGLRGVSVQEWKDMLRLVRCEVLSVIRQHDVDAFLLSESSMFIFDYKLVIKTCGRTTLLRCLSRLLKIAKTRAGLNGPIEYVFYSRKSFMFPDHQPFPHNDWNKEVDVLNHYFPHGSAYVVGKTNGDHWFCYLWEEKKKVPYAVAGDSGDSETDLVEAFVEEPFLAPGPNDQTLEILMCDLDVAHAQCLFYKEKGLDACGRSLVTTHLQRLYKEALIDDFMFDPCGYSCNGVTPLGYFTIHVTPEAHCSYASFETNIVPAVGDEHGGDYPRSYAQLISSIVQLFKPGRFTVTLFTEKDKGPESSAIDLKDASNRHLPTIGNAVRGFDRKDKILYEFENYDLMFYHYVKEVKPLAPLPLTQLDFCTPGGEGGR